MSAILQAVNDHFNALPGWGKAVVGTAAAALASYSLLYANKSRVSPYKKDFVPGVVYLYQFFRSPCIPSVSPFCLKLETWLRMESIKYENVEVPAWAVRSKEGTLPFVELDGKEYDDSGFIITELARIKKNQGEDREGNLANEQRAVARAFEQMIENSTAWSYRRVRYLEKYDEFASDKILPPTAVRYVTFPFVRWSFQSKIRNRLMGHGMGRHTAAEIDSIGIEDLKAVSSYLGVKRFFLGDQPHRVDAALFGLLAQIVYLPIDCPHKEFLKNEGSNIVTYCDKIKEKYWPDWNEVCGKLMLNTSYNMN